MKIALVSQHANPCSSTAALEAGDDVRLRDLSRGLAESGHQVTVYTQPAEQAGADPDEIIRSGVRVVHLGSPAGHGEAELLASVPGFASGLRDRIRRDRPDVVHGFRWTSGLAALAATRELDVPVVQSFTSLGTTEQRHRLIPPSACPERIRLEPAIGRGASAVIAASAEEEADLARIGVPRRSVKVIPCGIDTDEFTPEGPTARRNERPRLLTVADLDAYDELAAILRALARIPDAELVIVGGPDRDQLADDPAHRKLASMASRLGVAGRVVFTGQVKRAALPPLLRSADLALAMSGSDFTGMTALEAMACGTPVVASAVGAHLDAVVDGTTGLLIQPGRPALLADGIRRLLHHPMRLSAFGVAAVDRARSRYALDRIAHETLEAYDSVRPVIAHAA
jgi:glycosyltransferase involved in cell wall biosynthesis